MIKINKIKQTDKWKSLCCYNCCVFLNVSEVGISFFYDFTPSKKIVDEKICSAGNRKRLKLQAISYIAGFG